MCITSLSFNANSVKFYMSFYSLGKFIYCCLECWTEYRNIAYYTTLLNIFVMKSFTPLVVLVLLCKYSGGSVFHWRAMGNLRHRDFSPVVAKVLRLVFRLPTMADSTTFCGETRLPTPQSVCAQLRIFIHRLRVITSRVAPTTPSMQTDVIYLRSFECLLHTHAHFHFLQTFNNAMYTVPLWCNTKAQLPTKLSPRSNRKTIRRVECFDNNHFLIRRMPSCYSVQRCQQQQTNFPSLKICFQ
jgi:hypothetical protein